MKKRYGLLMICSLFTASCGNSKQEEEAEKRKDLINTVVVNNPETFDGVDSTIQAPKLKFIGELTYDFGNIPEGKVVTTEFEFENVGNLPLIISSTYASCGCTVPEKPKDPILPGEKNKIKVSYNSEGKSGIEEKKVIVYCNDPKGSHELTIKVNVLNN